MGERIIQKAIEINAAVDKVWRVFTDPAITRQMGGEYVTDWKVGSSFGWIGKDGNVYTHGAILQLEKESLLKHNLFDAAQKVLSVITYGFIDKNGQTTLLAQEELNAVTEEQFEEAMEGWDAALTLVKKTAEKL